MTMSTDPDARPDVEDPGTGSSLLEVRGLHTEFRTGHGTVHAVNGIDLTVPRSAVVGIVGESGSGKSVTARSIMRMIRSPGRITAGEVRFEGTDLLTLPEEEMRDLRGRRIAMVFQDPQSALNPAMTVRDQIAEALIVHGADRTAARARAIDLLQQVGIPDAEARAGDYPHQFSGGMRQRVVIAVGLANSPSLLIADEPTTALDVTIQAQILRLLGQLRDEFGVAVLMITHDMGVVAETCDDVVVMYGGRVVERGPVEAIFAAPEHPYTADLLRAMPRMDDPDSDRQLPSIPGNPPDPANLPSGCSFHPRCRLAEPECREQVPPLTSRDDGLREAACLVTERGDTIPPLQVTAAGRSRPAPAGEAPLLQVEGLRVNVVSGRGGLFRRPAPVFAVDDLDLELSPGETLGLVGESGCGKSTLARTIVGINELTSGHIRIGGEDVRELGDPATLRSTIQYVFQDPYASLNPRRTVRQSLEEALAVRAVPPRERQRAAVDLLDRVGLHEQHLDRYPDAFSGGQRQRIGIARALAVQPKLLICDEPVSALDVSIQAQIINLLETLRDDMGLGYLFIAHDLSVVRHLSDRVAVMYLGRIVETGPVQAIYGSPQHPYTKILLASTPVPDPTARGRERIVITGDLPSPKNPPSGCRFRTRCPIGPMAHPDRRVCIEEAPRLQPTATGQLASCHFAGEL